MTGQGGYGPPDVLPPRPTPFELWRQSGGDGVTYRHLLRQHGHLVPVKPGEKAEPLPCGWPKRPESLQEPSGSDSTDPGALDAEATAQRADGASGSRSAPLVDAIRTRTVEVLRLTHPTPAQLAVFAEVWDADLRPWLLDALDGRDA